jgi:hypothetical protein
LEFASLLVCFYFQNFKLTNFQTALLIYFNRHIRADESTKHASGAILWFDHTSGVVSGGTEAFGQANHLMRTCHYTQLTGFASFFIHLYFRHKNFSSRLFLSEDEFNAQRTTGQINFLLIYEICFLKASKFATFFTK